MPKAEQRCQCGAVALVRARGKYGLKRWRREVQYLRAGFCTEHRDDICLYVERGTNHFPGFKGKLRTDADYRTQPAVFTVTPIIRVARHRRLQRVA